MTGESSSRLLLPRPLRELPADLAALVVLALLTDVAVFVPAIRETPLRIGLGLAFVLFVPGYAFVAALFPEAGKSVDSGSPDQQPDPDPDLDLDSDPDTWNESTRAGLDGLERVALSFGLSIVIVPLVGLVSNFTPWGIRLVPIVVALNAVTLVSVAVAAVRRRHLPVDERFRVPYREWIAAGRGEALAPSTRADTVLNVVLAASVLLAVGTVGYTAAVSQPSERVSTVYVLTEADGGDLVADNYPTEFEPGESEEVLLGVDNDEHRTTEYTIVAIEQVVEVDGNDSVVREQRELERLEPRLAHGETWHHSFDLEPTLPGENVRIAWLLYLDEVPDEPSFENAENRAHLWITVDDADSE